MGRVAGTIGAESEIHATHVAANRMFHAAEHDRVGGRVGFVDLSLEEGSRITALAMRRDLRLVAAGSIDPTGGARTDVLVARMAFDGTLDTTFDGNGRARYPINADGDTLDTPAAIALSGERPVIVGKVYNNLTPSWHTGVLRLSSDLIFRHGME